MLKRSDSTGTKKKAATPAEVLRLGDGDFDRNEQGKLGDTQRKRLRRQRLEEAGTVLFLAVFLAVILGYPLIGDINAVRSAAFLFLLLFMSPVIAGLVIGARRLYRTHSDLRDDRVRTLEGRIHQEIKRNPAWGGDTYRVHIDDMQFNVDHALFLTFKNGEPYRVYASPRSGVLLGAEQVLDADPFVTDEAHDAEPVPDDGAQPFMQDETDQQQQTRRG